MHPVFTLDFLEINSYITTSRLRSCQETFCSYLPNPMAVKYIEK